MNEQTYYTYSTVGSGASTGERFRAQSPELGSPNNDPLRTLRKYLSYKLPAGSNPQTPLEVAPISLSLVKTDHNVVLIHKVCAGKDGVGRPGNFFSHAIINPAVVSPQAGTVEPISAYDAITLWRSSCWKTSEDQITSKGTEIPSLAPEALGRYIGRQPNFSPTDWQTALDWLPQILPAFLMLRKINKTHIFIAAPSDMIAAFIWCISRCLPRTLTIMQELTFSTYEHEIAKTSVTIAGTCWLAPANHKGPFVPQSDLPVAFYQPSPTNAVLAFNCYTLKDTPFNTEEGVRDFVQFCTEALLGDQNKLAQLDQLIAQAEKGGYQDVDDFLELFRISQGEPTPEKVQVILENSHLWFFLHDENIQKKLIELLQNQQQDINWRKWWRDVGNVQIQQMYQWAAQQPQSEEAAALSALAEKMIRELLRDLKGANNDWVKFWDELLKSISDPSTNPALWSTLPQHLLKLPYSQTYHSWWQQSGQQITQQLRIFVSQNSARPEIPQLAEALKAWSQQVTQHVWLAWQHPRDTHIGFWLDILQTIQPPTKGSADWNLLLKELDRNLDRTLSQGQSPIFWCEWEVYKTLLMAWSQVLEPNHAFPVRWLDVPWVVLPQLLEIPGLPAQLQKFALEKGILLPQGVLLEAVTKCAPLIHDVLAELIEDDKKRERAVTFCESLLQQGYALRDPLLASVLPPLFFHQNLTERIAVAANLSVAQLNRYVEEPLYNALQSQPSIPPWLVPRLESYLTNFRVQTLNPDRQEISREKRKRIYSILDNLAQRHKTLPEDLHPYLFCWYALEDFFSQPIFDRDKLRILYKRIDMVVLSEEMRQELNQEMIAFLSQHVETDLNIQRVIDTFDDLLLQKRKSDLPPHVLLLTEMTHQWGKAGYDQRKTIEYIKVVLSEAVHLSESGTATETQTQFVDECLDYLLTAFDRSQLSIKTLQWPPSFQPLWDAYLSRWVAGKTTATSQSTHDSAATTVKSWPGSTFSPAQPQVQGSQHQDQAGYYPIQSTSQGSPQTRFEGNTAYGSSGGNQPKITLPDPSQAKRKALLASNTNPPSTIRNPRGGIIHNIQSKFNKSDNSEEEVAPNTLLTALDSKDVDQIAHTYDKKLNRWLTPEQRRVAVMAQKLVQTHEDAQKTGNYRDFIKTYNAYFDDFVEAPDDSPIKNSIILSGDINATVTWLRELAKRK